MVLIDQPKTIVAIARSLAVCSSLVDPIQAKSNRSISSIPNRPAESHCFANLSTIFFPYGCIEYDNHSRRLVFNCIYDKRVMAMTTPPMMMLNKECTFVLFHSKLLFARFIVIIIACCCYFVGGLAAVADAAAAAD